MSANWPASAVLPVVMPCGLRAAQIRVPGAVIVGVRLLSGAPTDEKVDSCRSFCPAATQMTRPPQYVLSVFGAL